MMIPLVAQLLMILFRTVEPLELTLVLLPLRLSLLLSRPISLDPTKCQDLRTLALSARPRPPQVAASGGGS